MDFPSFQNPDHNPQVQFAGQVLKKVLVGTGSEEGSEVHGTGRQRFCSCSG